MEPKRQLRIYDHRLVQLVQETGDPTIAVRLGVPRSTAAGWTRRARRTITSAVEADAPLAELRRRVARLEKRNQRLTAVLRVLFALLRTFAPDLSRLRVPALDKARLLRAIERTRSVLGLSGSSLSSACPPLGSTLGGTRRWPASSRTNRPARTPRRSG